jgi:hypothetical protein
MKCDFHRILYKRRLKTTRGLSTSQPRTAKEVLGRHLQDKVYEELEDDFRSAWKAAVLGYEELGGLSDPGLRDCAYSIEYS